ncbi:MAG: hydratase [Oscillospiraceae bacterium]|nr:hydratase [Oscillospiraceae bacterium]
MVKVSNSGSYYKDGRFGAPPPGVTPGAARENTLAYQILRAHAVNGDPRRMMIKFDALASHDITYVGVVQTARASGLDAFPVPYVLTNCHNSLCAVGGTINADDHAFGLSAAKRYGGEFVPAHLAVIHQYMRERYAASGRMILASDSHTRYGAFGTLAIGEGGPELVKQLLGRAYELTPPPVWAVRLTGAPRPGVGPQDVALALIAAVFPKGLVKNCVLEFVGDGIARLDMDYRNGIDVMTTETTCLSSVWQTDGVVRDWLSLHGRADAYRPLSPDGAYYDGLIDIDLSKVEPMIALPFHPSNAFTIREFNSGAGDILRAAEREAAALWGLKEAPNLTAGLENGRLRVQQGFIGGCAGGLYGNIRAASAILERGRLGDDIFELSVYPSSQPMLLELTRDGTIAKLIEAGAVVRTAFCGPCFGAGDVPVNKGLSIRHATRNFPNREGSKPGSGQTAYVALMDARSIAATSARGGLLTAADELDNLPVEDCKYSFDDAPYRQRVFSAVGRPDKNAALRFGPGISDWPEQIALPDDIELTVTAVLNDAVTTTDELIPSGETSSFRSNPEHLAEFTLSRRAPDYVGLCKDVRELERGRRAAGGGGFGLGSAVVARKPGDGSAREQAASCQRVLGGLANVASEYATRRYRSNLINWGILPFIVDDFDAAPWETGGILRIPGVRGAVAGGAESVGAVYITAGGAEHAVTLRLPGLSAEEREVLLAGCLINHYRN